jgi:flagellar biosynthesis protein FliR
MVAPFWSNTSINARMKIGLSCFISLIIMPFVSPVSPLPETVAAFLFLVLKQIFFGIISWILSVNFL